VNASEGEWGGDRKRWRVECKNRRRIKFEGGFSGLCDEDGLPSRSRSALQPGDDGWRVGWLKLVRKS